MRGEPVDWFEVVSKIEAGEASALLRLTSLVGSIMSHMGAYRSQQGRDDLIQEVTLSLIRSVRKDAIQDRSRFVAYAWRVVRNRLINDASSRARRAGQDPRIDPDELASAGSAVCSAPEHASDPMTRVDLKRALADLPMSERVVIEAIYLQGLSYAEACEQLGLPLGTVKRRQWQGLRSLRVRMGLTDDAD